MTDETQLPGGWVTKGVVRVGDTVRRPLGPNAEFVHRLLNELAQDRFDEAPRFLGIDDSGREVLSFIDGAFPNDTQAAIWTDEQLTAAAQLLRRFHDTTAGRSLRGAAEVVCHNDFGPWNLVWREGIPVGLIDFDNAAPGARLDDLGYAAWKHLNLGLNSVSVVEQRHRLSAFVNAYGEAVNGRFLHAIDAQQRRMQGLIERATNRGRDAAVEQIARERAWLRQHGSELVS